MKLLAAALTIAGALAACQAPDSPEHFGAPLIDTKPNEKAPLKDTATTATTDTPAPAPKSGAADPDGSPEAHAHGALPHGSSTAGEVFWTAFNAGRYDDLGKVQDALAASIDKTPDPYVQRLLGVSYFWETAEAARTGGGFLGGALPAMRSIRALEAAKEKAPGDAWLPCFLGILQYELGSQTHSASKKAAGLAELERGIAMYPEFNTYCRALARGGEPRGSAEWRAAVADFWKVLELCDPSISRDHPTVGDPSRMGGCTQRARVPHGYNGIWMTFGDVMAKEGDEATARAFYENAKRLAYEDWPERASLEARLTSLHEDVARWTDADPKNDPELAFHSSKTCVMCHAR